MILYAFRTKVRTKVTQKNTPNKSDLKSKNTDKSDLIPYELESTDFGTFSIAVISLFPRHESTIFSPLSVFRDV